MVAIKVEVLRAAYNDAIEHDEQTVTIKGCEFHVPYLKYVLEHVELRQIQDHEYLEFTPLEMISNATKNHDQGSI